MAFDLDLIRNYYSKLSSQLEIARKELGRPMTLTEKILYSHLYNTEKPRDFVRGKDYVNFAPDRVAMQDATAQMALLQFMQAGKEKTAVPSTVHCDHLIQAKTGAAADLKFGYDHEQRGIRFSLRCIQQIWHRILETRGWDHSPGYS